MGAVRGIFSISKVRSLSLENAWVNLSTVWIDQLINSGYFGGGETSGLSPYVSSIHRLSFANDTTNILSNSNLNTARKEHAAISSPTSGYFGGGGIPGISTPLSTTEKLTYSTNTISSINPNTSLSLNRYALTAAASPTSGYFCGGFFTTPSIQSRVDKLVYSTDTTSYAPTANLTASRYYAAATGNTTTGYIGGGYTPALVSRMDKLSYSTDTTSFIPSGNLSSNNGNNAATGSSTSGYFGGGVGPGINSNIDKLTYSTDTTSSLSSKLTENKYALSATGNTSSGYFGGGASGPISTVEKLSYTTETSASKVFASLSLPLSNSSATSSRENATLMEWQRFSDGFETTNPALIPQETPTSDTYPVYVPTPNTGYFHAGTSSANISSTEKITFSTETISSATPSPLIGGLRGCNIGDSNKGYYTGGETASVHSTIDRIYYTTDTTVTIPAVLLLGVSGTQYGHTCTGSSSNGYIGGGYQGPGFEVQKINYTTESVAALPSPGYLSDSRRNFAAVGNLTAGYFCGGSLPAGQGLSSIDKLTYSTETRTTPTNMSIGRGANASSGNSTFGYFGTGASPTYPGGYHSLMDKLAYSSDTVAASPTASLNIPIRDSNGVGNSDNGYFAGGLRVGGITVSSINKLIYATDTSSLFPSANMITARYEHESVSARSNALPQSTINPTPVNI